MDLFEIPLFKTQQQKKWNLISLSQYVFKPTLLHVPAAPADLSGRGRELGSSTSSSPGSDLQRYGNKGKSPSQLLM